MSGTCYTGCSPTTTLLGHGAPPAHLAFTGAGNDLVLIAVAGFVCLLAGFAFWVWRRRG